MVSRFSEFLFLDVPGTATEQVRTCGFRRNSSSFDKAPKIRDSVLLNSFILLRVSLLLCLRSPQKPGRCNLELIQGQVRSALYCFYCFQVFLSKLLLISFYFLTLPYRNLGKNFVSGED